MKKRLLSLFILLFIPSLIASCDTKIEESKNSDNNSSITETSVEDSSSTREKDSFPEKSSSSYESITFESSSVKTEPYGYTIEDGKMNIDVSGYDATSESFYGKHITKIISGNTYDVYELDLLYINASINIEDITSSNENINIFKDYRTGRVTLALDNAELTDITISYEDESYIFSFNIIEVKTIKFDNI